MTTAESTTGPAAHPRTRTMESWRARLGVLASRGETDGPRVAEARAALTWWRHRTYLTRDMGIAPDQADALLDAIDQHAADADVVTSA
ncbi:hypothetical protein ACKUUI_02310 [Mycobacterium seoulense]|uniref:hypothetical protein n=1 Tax=Mycobacterium seoulense TaxID=386911 RepID=UPI003CEF00BB